MTGRLPSALAAAAAIATLIVGVIFGTHAAGGSDSSCYLNTARLLSRGSTTLTEPLMREAAWPMAALTFTPAGFTPSSVDRTRLVPICSPGLPLAMALFRFVRLDESLVVPLLGAVAVWFTYIVGRRIDRPLTGTFAAMLLACSPTLVYQLVQPMSDVPAMAWWMLAIACAIECEDGTVHPWLAGWAASMAVATRPNLLPLAAVLGAYLVVAHTPGSRMRRLTWFGAGLIPGGVLLGVLQWATYGSPWSTGYGSVGQLMSMAHVVPNLRRYAWWLIDSHTPILLIALAAPFVMPRPRHAWLSLAMIGTTVACYLPYLLFDDWWYTRFLLPALPLIIILTVAVLMAAAERVIRGDGAAVRVSIVGVCVMALMVQWISTARTRHAFELSEWEQHFYRAGKMVTTRVAGPASIVTVRNSGSVRYYAGRSTVSWDTLAPEALDATLTFLRDRGRDPYLLLERDEEPAFRARFGAASEIGQLDWPPRVQVGRMIRLYDPRDRAQFLIDGTVRTQFLAETAVPLRDWRRWVGLR